MGISDSPSAKGTWQVDNTGAHRIVFLFSIDSEGERERTR